MAAYSIVISSTFTAEPIDLPLSAWLRWLSRAAQVKFAPYNQVFQQLLDPHSLLATHKSPSINVLLVRVDDWSESGDSLKLAQHAEEFLSAVERFSMRSEAQLLVCFCPTSKTASDPIGKQCRDIERALLARLANQQRIHLVPSSEVELKYPVVRIHDELARRAGQIPYTQAYFTALATLLARRINTLQTPPAKVVVLDCDQTLWEGVCGEVAADGVGVSDERRALQTFLLQLREKGFLLCLCSKNNEADAWAVFDSNRRMVLKREHITAARINWNSKPENLISLSKELRLGLDSFVFIDDSPLECAEVRSYCPEVLTLQLPEDGKLLEFMRHVWPFDRLSSTPEDGLRAELYTQEVRRNAARSQAPSLTQFLSELHLEVDFLSLTPDRLERAAQLTERTNQFNFTTIRRHQIELQQLCDQGYQSFLVQARDRFGDYGLVGLCIYSVHSSKLLVDTFLLSCRALGRNIERRMLRELKNRASQAGASHIEFEFRDSEKNQPAKLFVESVFGKSRLPGSTPPLPATYRLATDELEAALEHNFDRYVEEETQAPEDCGPIAASRPSSANFVGQIASELRSVQSIMAKIRREASPRPELDEPFSPPQTAVESRVVEICKDVLNLAQVGVHDGLKDLGASSLQIVQIYSRLEEEFASGIAITDLFALPTIDSIIRRVGKTDSPALQAGIAASRVENQSGSQGIAIIGMAGRFPGALSVSEFWRNITAGVCSIVDIPEEQLNLPSDSPLRKNPNLVRRAASVQDVDKFDAKFFGIFPKEATVMDPQHRIMLETCWHAIEDAGYNVEAINVPVGVFAGCYMDTYILSSLTTSPQWIESLANAFHGGDLLTELGNDKDYLATRVSFLLNLRGPSITIQTACSTSLVAISQACQSLMSGQCDMALAGGATLKLPQNRGYLYTEGGMVSPDGVCRTFDAKARGTVFGEGCGVVLLKRVEDALADGDDIYAVVKGWGLNNDGRAKMGYTAPSVEGQIGAIRMAHRMAGVSAASITMLEAHGTGTALGDPIEIDSLSRVFRHTTDKKQFCAIGSVKTNIGHLDVAAGVTGLIKTSLSLKNRVIPPSLHFEQPNPNIDFASSPFFVNTRLRPWDAPAPRRAGLSSFGVGGTNAHVVVEEAPDQPATTPQVGPQLLTLSARSPAALENQRVALLEHLQANPQLDIADVAYTLQTGRKTFNYTSLTLANSSAHAREVLTKNDPQQVFQHRQIRRGKSTVFMFPGQGSQHLNMARELYKSDAIFRAHFDQCVDLLLPLLGFDLRDKIFVDQASTAAAEALNQTSVAQTGIFTVAYALAQRFADLGITPRRMLGHSVGEFVAACLAGVFSLEDALRMIAYRALHMQQLPGGSMLAVRLTEVQLLEQLTDSMEIAIAAVNGPQLCVVSGPTSAVDALQQSLEAQAIVCRPLHTSHAFHSAMMDSVVAPFAEQLRTVELHAPQIPIISSVTGQFLTDTQAIDPLYWARHLRATVRFTDSLATLLKDSDAVLLEVGPGQNLCTLARQHPDRKAEQAVLSTLPHAKQTASSRESYLLSLGRLWQSGVDVDWNRQFADQRRRRLHLPGYPFERLRYWISDSLPNCDLPPETTGAAAAPVCPNTLPPNISHSQAKPSYGESHRSEVDGLAERVIQQQLNLMRQQLEAWKHS